MAFSASSTGSLRRKSNRLMGEINVVPYIDVMLVLLVIFMATAPLLQQGVKVELPQAESSPVQDESEAEPPIVVTVDQHGIFSIEVGLEAAQVINGDGLQQMIRQALAKDAKLSVYVRGDRRTTYDWVMKAMVLIQQAGVENVGLLT